MRIAHRTAGWMCAAMLTGAGLWNLPAWADDNQNQNDNSQEDEQVATIPPGATGTYQRGVHPPAAGKASQGSNLIDHGGKVIPASHVYFIWWGTQASFPSDAKAGLEALAAYMNGTGYLGIMQQYMRGTGITSAYVSAATDISSPPSRSPSTGTILNEACKAISASGWKPDPTALYAVVTSNFPGGHVNYCAWHTHGTCNGVDIQFAYLPNTTGIAGCDPGNLYSCNAYSQGTRSIANVYAHEFSESITDADLNAWYDNSGAEIGDKCAWQFAACVNVGAAGQWQLQEEWSNSINGCAQQ